MNASTRRSSEYPYEVERVPTLDKGMYGLPQAGRLAMTKVTAVLAQAGYNECRFTKMVFRHETRPITFALVVDDFLIKYSAKADADHLIRALETTHALKTDWAATKYLGIDLTWDYASTPRAVTLSMPGYVDKGVNRFSPWLGSDRKVQHGPGIPAPIIYGPPVAPPDDTSDLLPPAEKTLLQALVGYYRYYAEAIDSTMLVKLGQLGSQQAQPTQRTKQQASQFLDYCHTWPNASITFQASDMVLTCVSDGSHRGEPNGKSRVAGYLYYGSAAPSRQLNSATQVLCRLLDVQTSSACETELGGLFENGRAVAALRATAADFGYPQDQPTEVECDNKCAVGIATEQEKQKRAAAMDMRFLWVADRVRQGQLKVIWRKGETNAADYSTKIHPHKHHKERRHLYVTDTLVDSTKALQDRRPTIPPDHTRVPKRLV
jgi:hypothetical protein